MNYFVRPGENFQKVCEMFQLTPKQLMDANKLTEPFVAPSQTLNIPNPQTTTGITKQDSRTLALKEGTEIEDWRSEEVGSSTPDKVPTPQETLPVPGGPWPTFVQIGQTIAMFKEKDMGKILKKEVNIPIYISRAAFFFMSKMAVEETGCFSICGAQCRNCFKSENVPFYVIPHNTNWVNIGDYGVVINTRTKKAAYAICADWGPKHDTKILTEGTTYSGRMEKARSTLVDSSTLLVLSRTLGMGLRFLGSSISYSLTRQKELPPLQIYRK